MVEGSLVMRGKVVSTLPRPESAMPSALRRRGAM